MNSGTFLIHRVSLGKDRGSIVCKNKKGFAVKWKKDKDGRFCSYKQDRIVNYSSASSLKEFQAVVREQLSFLWGNYACRSDDEMTRDARSLANYLRKRFVKATKLRPTSGNQGAAADQLTCSRNQRGAG